MKYQEKTKKKTQTNLGMPIIIHKIRYEHRETYKHYEILYEAIFHLMLVLFSEGIIIQIFASLFHVIFFFFF